jgi:Leucine-rich repeat (LRR) protein
MKSRLPASFLSKFKFKNLSIYEIYKITNKKVKFLFDSLYDNLLDETNKFGSETKFLDFFFLILPNDILNDSRKLMSFLFEQSVDEQEFLLCDSFSFLDEQELKYGKKNGNFIAVICKCAYFEETIEEIKGEDMSLNSLEEIKEHIRNKAKTMEGRVVKLCLRFRNTNFYYFNLKGLVAPEYIVEYNYSKENENECEDNSNESENNGIISSFQYKLNMNPDCETVFNLCSQHFYNPSFIPKQYFCKETINKNNSIKIWDFNELENNFLFFAKNSVITYIKNCFKYQTYQDYLNEINKINEKIKEITDLKFQSNYIFLFYKYLENLSNKKPKVEKNSEKEEEKKVEINNDDIEIEWAKLKTINLFNLDITNELLDELLNKIKASSLENTSILNMTKNCESLYICKNKLNKIDLNKIFEIFPNLLTLDISHNNISKIIYTANDDIKYSLSSLNISYNNITDFRNIITILKNFENLSEFVFFANPYNREFECLTEKPTKTSISSEEKENIIKLFNDNLKNKNKTELTINISEDNTKINNTHKNFDYIYDCFSFNDKYHSFSDNIYFREKIHKESTYRTVILSKKKLFCIPTIEGGSNTQVLYINLNKITKITNLNQFEELLELYIQNNKIKQIENLPVSLKKLDISNNEFNTLDGIDNSKDLEWFNFENNNIKSISKINKLLNIKELYCAGNYINNPKECCQLGKLKKLEIIDLTGNEVCRLVKDLRITMIYYCRLLKNFNRINIDEQERIKAKEYFTGKLTSEVLEKRLGVGYNTFNLIELDLSSLKLKDEVNLFSKEIYPKLTKLNISRNIFKTFAIFGKLPYLVELNLNFNLFTEIFPKKAKLISGKGIFGIPNLETLEIAGNQLINLNGIQFFKKLKILNLRENSLAKIDCINHMEFLSFLDVSFNKLRNCDKTGIGLLPSLKYFLCDNNYLKNINGFEKFVSAHTMSFENNKIPDYNSLEKLANLEYLKDLDLGNNPVTKSINHRNTIIRMFSNLLKLDKREITKEEREMIAMEMQMDGNSFEDEQYEIYGGGAGGEFMVQKKLISANYNYNIQRMQDKALKRVNYVQIGYMIPPSLPNQVFVGNQMMRGRIDSNNPILIQNKKVNNNQMNNCNLPQIRNNNNGNNKPISSDSKKRIYRWSSHLNGSMNNLTNNNSNNYLSNVNVNIINKNIPAPRSNNRAGSIQPLGKGLNPLNPKQDYIGLQVNNLTNDFSPSINVEKLTPAKTGKNFSSVKNGKKYK